MLALPRFPHPVNETSARGVAAGVVVLSASFVATGHGWLLAVLVYGFAARVAAGPTLSPLGQFATRMLTPAIERRVGPGRLVPGPPKRFAQTVGLAFSMTAAVLWLAGEPGAAKVTIALLLAAALLEAAFAVCLGCIVFGWLMRAGVVPETVCAECNDISSRLVQRESRTEARIAAGE